MLDKSLKLYLNFNYLKIKGSIHEIKVGLIELQQTIINLNIKSKTTNRNIKYKINLRDKVSKQASK